MKPVAQSEGEICRAGKLIGELPLTSWGTFPDNWQAKQCGVQGVLAM